MNSAIVGRTRLHEEANLSKSEEFSPPESKRLRLDDGCNNNLNSTVNSESQNSTRWSYSGNASLIEPEILEDMGVGMLEDGTVNCEKTSGDCIILPANLVNNKKSPIDEADGYEDQEEVYTISSSETVNEERIQQDSCDLDELAIFGGIENESGYSSRIEADYFVDLKANLSKEKMNASADKNEQTGLDNFCLFKRKRKPSIKGEDKFNKLSDEIILMILKWLPKKCLVRSMFVCKRWCQIARDEALWTRLDLGSKVLSEGTLGHILPRGIQILRLAQAEIADPIFCEGSEVLNDSYISKLQYLDLSMAVISPTGLAALLSKCKYLKKLSLENCIVNRDCCKAISQNIELEVLNLTMCKNMNIECIMDLMKLKNLTVLNMAWCSLDSECMTLLCKTLPSSILRLNLAGCRKTMTDDNVKDLSRRCPDIIELDLSDCAMLTIHTVHNLLNFSRLEHLSLSRCYSIPQSAYIRLAHIPCLLYLDVFGLMSDSVLTSLQASCREVPEINKYLYSSVARPTVGIRRTSIWGLRVRD
ncbi:S-phase kinase-associated protein 2 isoform X1 [Cataglyphis hispanica]|uniref:S-phase kinase-associated protein 2 isoform X1 n=2 Tax=Cataglyphis hispanica TaxID=1086592 RepID=UPI0021800C6A|nr:S-phase kinase-associated protein 2 isoform X1 [Cataglyphis hispanica]